MKKVILIFSIILMFSVIANTSCNFKISGNDDFNKNEI